LAAALKKGYRPIIFFLVQRGEATAFAPADAIDSEYGRLLRQVVAEGLEAMAYKTIVSTTDNRARNALPVVL